MPRAVAIVSALALVVVPVAAALAFTDDSFNTPTGFVGAPYSHQLEGTGGCGPGLPYQFRVLTGDLPPGISMASNGLLSGTPSKAGTWSFWAELSDQDPPSQAWCVPRKSEREFAITILATPADHQYGVPAPPETPADHQYGVPAPPETPADHQYGGGQQPQPAASADSTIEPPPSPAAAAPAHPPADAQVVVRRKPAWWHVFLQRHHHLPRAGMPPHAVD